MKYIEVLQTAIDFMELNLEEEITIGDVANEVSLHETDFIKLFSFVTRYTPNEYLRYRRLFEAAKELTQTSISIGDIAAKYTYFNHSSFTRAFTSFHGHSPKDIRLNSLLIKPFIRIQLERNNDMDFKVIELPKTKMARSGKHSLKSFDQWWTTRFNQEKSLFPKDFMWNNQQTNKLEWIYILEDNESSDQFETFMFPGGHYATATCLDNSKDKSKTYFTLINKVAQSKEYEQSTIVNDPFYHSRYPMGHVSTPKDSKSHQFTLFVPLVKK